MLTPLLNTFQLVVCVDIIGSTKYKHDKEEWIKDFKSAFEIMDAAFVTQSTGFCFWKSVGDARVYIRKIESIGSLSECLDRILNCVKIINNESPLLPIKAAAWLFALPEKGSGQVDVGISGVDILFNNPSPYSSDSVREIKERDGPRQQEQKEDEEIYKMVDFIGQAIDRGFRLVDKSRKGQVVVCHIILGLLHSIEKSGEDEAVSNRFFIYEYAKLKGIWREKDYPIVFIKSKNSDEYKGNFFAEEELNIIDLPNKIHSSSGEKYFLTEIYARLDRAANQTNLDIYRKTIRYIRQQNDKFLEYAIGKLPPNS